MNKLMKLRLDNLASKYIMSKILKVDVGAYDTYEHIKYENIPCSIRQDIESLITDNSAIVKYYERYEDALNHMNFERVIEEANLTLDKVAEYAGTSVEDANALVDDTTIFSDQEASDRLISYMIDINDMLEQNKEGNKQESEPQVDSISIEELSKVREENNKLKVQLEWYEDIITSFINLSNMVKEK